MDNEIKKPELDKPTFLRPPYDYRNREDVGEYRGVGEAGKVGLFKSTSIDPMPRNPQRMNVPKDYKK